MKDQAEKLRKLVANVEIPKIGGARSIAVVSGKGGVGKSNISVFLAKAFAARQKKVLILDGDLGLANLHILLGILPKGTLSSYLRNECKIEAVIHKISENIDLIPGGSGDISTTANLSRMFADLANLVKKYDYLIIDGGAGIAENTLRLAISANEAVLVMTPDPTSLTDAYAMLKVLHSREQRNISLLVNMAQNENEVEAVKSKFFMLSKQFIDFTPKYLGFLPQSRKLTPLIRESFDVLSREVGDFSVKINMIAAKIDGEKPAEELNFFAKFAQTVRGKL
jgi:flagellar biosynthesis protein FlhG